MNKSSLNKFSYCSNYLFPYNTKYTIYYFQHTVQMATIFERIIAGEIPSKKLYEDDKAVIIMDINPVRK